MKIAAIGLILLACFLIGLGRAKIRRARHAGPLAASRPRAAFIGWILVLAGVVAMIAGVITF